MVRVTSVRYNNISSMTDDCVRTRRSVLSNPDIHRGRHVIRVFIFEKIYRFQV